jgi:NitT/TauT family transport system permease protein
MHRLVYPIILACWIVASAALPLNHYFLPDAFSLSQTVVDPVFLQDLLWHLAATFSRVIVGVALALCLAIPLGIAMARNELTRVLAEPVIDFLRGIPIAMLFPLFIVFVGLGELSRTLIVLTLALPIVALSVYISARPNDDNAERLAYFKLRRSLLSDATAMKMTLWEALPGVITGIRLALSLGLVVVIVTEMYFVASSGIGWRAFRAYENFQIDVLYFYIFVAGAASAITNRLINLIKF